MGVRMANVAGVCLVAALVLWGMLNVSPAGTAMVAPARPTPQEPPHITTDPLTPPQRRRPQHMAFGMLAGVHLVTRRVVPSLRTYLAKEHHVLLVFDDTPLSHFAAASLRIRFPSVQSVLLAPPPRNDTVHNSPRGAWKALETLRQMYMRLPPATQWYVMVDDDTYVFTDNVWYGMPPSSSSAAQGVVFGNTFDFTVATSDTPATKKQYVHGGTGIFMDRAAVRATVPFVDACNTTFRFILAGDARVGRCIRNAASGVLMPGYAPPGGFVNGNIWGAIKVLRTAPGAFWPLSRHGYPVSLHHMRDAPSFFAVHEVVTAIVAEKPRHGDASAAVGVQWNDLAPHFDTQLPNATHKEPDAVQRSRYARVHHLVVIDAETPDATALCADFVPRLQRLLSTPVDPTVDTWGVAEAYNGTILLCDLVAGGSAFTCDLSDVSQQSQWPVHFHRVGVSTQGGAGGMAVVECLRQLATIDPIFDWVAVTNGAMHVVPSNLKHFVTLAEPLFSGIMRGSDVLSMAFYGSPTRVRDASMAPYHWSNCVVNNPLVDALIRQYDAHQAARRADPVSNFRLLVHAPNGVAHMIGALSVFPKSTVKSGGNATVGDAPGNGTQGDSTAALLNDMFRRFPCFVESPDIQVDALINLTRYNRDVVPATALLETLDAMGYAGT